MIRFQQQPLRYVSASVFQKVDNSIHFINRCSVRLHVKLNPGIRKPQSRNAVSILNRRPSRNFCKSPRILVGQRIKWFIEIFITLQFYFDPSPPRLCLRTTCSKIHLTQWRQCCKLCTSHQSPLSNVSSTWTRTALLRFGWSKRMVS